MRRSKHHNLIPAIKSFRSSTLPETQEPLENVLNFRKQLAHKLKGFCMARLDNFMIGVILPIAGLFGAAMPFIAGGPDVAPVDPAPDPVAAARRNIRFGKYLGRIRSHRTPGLTLV